MKRLFLMLWIFSALFTGCDKDETILKPLKEGEIAITLNGTKENATKTAIGGETGNIVTWQSNDQLGVFVSKGSNSNLPFSLNPLDADKTAGQFFGALNSCKDGILYAYYPYAAANTTQTAIAVKVADDSGNQYFDGTPAGPGEVSGNFTDFGKYACMVADPVPGINLAANATTVVAPVLIFRHVTCVLDFVLTSSADMTVEKVTLSSGGRTAFITGGKLNITTGEQEARLSVNDPEKSDEIKLVMGSSADKVKPFELKANEPKTVRMVVFPTNLTDIPITITVSGTVEGSTVNLSLVKNGKNLERGRCYKTPIDISVVKDLSSAEQAFTNGSNAVVITEPITSSASLTLPSTNAHPEQTSLSLTAPLSSGSTLTLQAPATGTAPEKVALSNTFAGTDTPGDVKIELPASTVNMQGTFNEVTASTAANTLIVEEGCEIKKLNVKQGNVKVYGTVTEVGEIVTGCKIVYYVKNVADFLEKIKGQGELMNLTLIAGKTYDFSTVESDVVIPKSLTITSDNPANPAKLIMGATVFRCSTSVSFENLDITGLSPLGAGLIHAIGDDMTLSLTNCRLEQKRAGIQIGNELGHVGVGIYMEGQKNALNLEGTSIYIPENMQRGITVTGSNTETKISLKKSKITTKNVSVPRVYSRGININNTKNNGTPSLIKLDETTVEGVYYALNIQGNNNLNVEVINNSLLDGRAGFNIWAKGVYTLKNSTIFGRNIYQGPTERFAGIVLNNDAAVSGSIVNIETSKIGSWRDPITPTNGQYALSIRIPDVTVNMTGSNTFVDESSTIPCFIEENSPAQLNGLETVRIETSRADAILCARGSKWDGISLHEPDHYIYQKVHYYDVYTAPELAWIAEQTRQSKIFSGSETTQINLLNDIDLGGYFWNTATVSKLNFSGNRHVISNFKVDRALTAGFFSTVISTTIQDLTLKNATITARQTNGDQNAYAGGFIGCCYGATKLTNCTLEGSTVLGINKVGGIVGFNAEDALVIEQCAVKKSTIKTDDTQPEHGQCGGILGYIGITKNGTTTLTGNCIMDSKVEAAANTNPNQDHRHVGIYVGCFQGSTADGVQEKLTITTSSDPSPIHNSTLNGAAVPPMAKYEGLLGGVRFTTKLSTSTILTINGTRYTE